MNIQTTTRVADEVLTHLRRNLRDFRREDGRGTLYVYPYLNGREQGWTLTIEIDLPVLTFSENRNSDDVVVYEDAEWNLYGNTTPSEESYENRRFFRGTRSAARHIAARVRALVDGYAAHRALQESV
jgi:hypothetical protein